MFNFSHSGKEIPENGVKLALTSGFGVEKKYNEGDVFIQLLIHLRGKNH